MKKILYLTLCIMLFFTSCVQPPQQQNSDDLGINNVEPETPMMNKLFDFAPPNKERLWIKENGEYIQYRVAHGNYDNNGGVLLVRERASAGNLGQHKYGTTSGYYPESEIDEFLNTEFILRLSPEVQNRLKDTYIKILAKDSLNGNNSANIDIIQRKVFLLSASELLGNTAMEIGVAPEGSQIKLYKDTQDYYNNEGGYVYDSTIAEYTRSCVWNNSNRIATYNFAGLTFGSAMYDEIHYIRPVFVLDGSTSVTLLPNFGNFEGGYVLDCEISNEDRKLMEAWQKEQP